ncbi:hypothetical protein AB0K00_39275 [Dactylosporangium sp. NPDC049525]|uniref:Rv0361 family membrane protein n=1 Tax=Dactylosporangium sp. NPDC049525 TaxID=3154730 RepID=UPI00343D88E6
MDPSKPNEPSIDQGRSIPRSRPGDDEVLEGEVIGKDEPLGRPAAVPPQPPEPPKRGLGLRKTLLLVLAVVAVGLCLGGSITAYVLYDKATRPERSSPSATLQQYVSARFERRDAIRAHVFECSSPQLQSVSEALAEIEELERKYGISVSTSLSDLEVNNSDTTADIRANVNTVIPEQNGQDSIRVQKWTFHLVKEDGWRVCSAERAT